MRLCIATGLYPPDIGGPATHTVFLEKHATELGLELVVVPFGNVRTYPPLIRHVVYLVKLIRKAGGCDAFYALDTVSVGVPAMLASVLTRRPLILRVPGDYAWEQGQQRFGITETLDEFRTHRAHPLPVRFLSWLQMHVARHATHVVVPSEYMKQVVAEWGIPTQRITRIYSVLKRIDVELSHKQRDGMYVVTTAARLVPWKGVGALIDAVASLHAAGVSVILRIIGDGVSRGELEERTRTLGANSYVHFLGSLNRDVMAREIIRSDTFVLNTSYEGLSHQLMEVMSLGVPVVTTAVGGNSELVTNEETGLIVPWNDVESIKRTLLRLKDDDALARSLRDRASASLSRFEESVIVSEFRSFFEAICDS